jgi:DNA-binding CsgD family transcriptional regulator/PAS domain-containing protein
MFEAKLLSQVVGDIYDAALNPMLWRAVLGRIAGFVGGQSAGLGSIDSVSKHLNACYTFGCDPHYLQLQIDTYAKFDPTTALFLFPPEQVASIADVMPYDDYLETRFYREWAQPQGWVDSASAVLDKSVTGFALLSVYRNMASGLVDDVMRRRMQLIVPHVRRAVMIGKAIDLKSTEAARLGDAFDGLSAAMFLVDASGRIVHCNLSGHDMLGEADILYSQQDILTAADPQAGQSLRNEIAAVSTGDTATGAVAVALSSSPDQHWLAHVLPLTSGARRRAGIAYSAVAAVFVRKTSLDMPSSMQAIAKIYKLTPSELRVFAAVVDVGGILAVADALGISEATVKTHLQHVFEKTGQRRQTDLMKLLANHANPLRA